MTGWKITIGLSFWSLWYTGFKLQGSARVVRFQQVLPSAISVDKLVQRSLRTGCFEDVTHAYARVRSTHIEANTIDSPFVPTNKLAASPRRGPIPTRCLLREKPKRF
jgi:hypothetical protein